MVGLTASTRSPLAWALVWYCVKCCKTCGGREGEEERRCGGRVPEPKGMSWSDTEFLLGVQARCLMLSGGSSALRPAKSGVCVHGPGEPGAFGSSGVSSNCAVWKTAWLANRPTWGRSTRQVCRRVCQEEGRMTPMSSQGGSKPTGHRLWQVLHRLEDLGSDVSQVRWVWYRDKGRVGRGDCSRERRQARTVIGGFSTSVCLGKLSGLFPRFPGDYDVPGFIVVPGETADAAGSVAEKKVQ